MNETTKTNTNCRHYLFCHYERCECASCGCGCRGCTRHKTRVRCIYKTAKTHDHSTCVCACVAAARRVFNFTGPCDCRVNKWNLCVGNEIVNCGRKRDHTKVTTLPSAQLRLLHNFRRLCVLCSRKLAANSMGSLLYAQSARMYPRSTNKSNW